MGIRCGLEHNSLDVDSLPISPLVTQAPTLDALYDVMWCNMNLNNSNNFPVCKALKSLLPFNFVGRPLWRWLLSDIWVYILITNWLGALIWTRLLQNPSDVFKTLGNSAVAFGGTYPSIIHGLISGVVLSILHYASPIWSSVLSSRGARRFLEWVLRLAGILTCGLLRTSSTEVSPHAQWTVASWAGASTTISTIWLRILSYEENLTVEPRL